MFINALSFALTNQPDTFKVLLKEIVDKYPNEDVAALSSEMIKGFQRGLLLSASGDNMLARGSLFNIRFGNEGEEAVPDSLLQFSEATKTPHELLLVYPKGSLNDNLLLYTVAGYNFGNFMVNDFGLEKTTIGEISLLRIKGFNNQQEVLQYLQKIRQPDGYAQDWGQAVVMVPISEENYTTLMKGKSLADYMSFFEKQFSQGNESIIAQWHLKQLDEMKVMPENEGESLLPENQEKTGEETKTSEATLPTDSTHTPSPVDSIPSISPVDSIPAALPADSVPAVIPDSTSTQAVITSDEVLNSVNEVYNKTSNALDEISNTFNDIASDPVRGISKLFKREKSNNAIEAFAKQQEKEDKERQKQLKKEQAEKDKAAKADAIQKAKEQKELDKKQAEEERVALKAKQQEKEEAAKKAALEKKQKETEKKQKEAERKQIAKEKTDAREKALKLKQEEQKAKEKARKEELKRKEKAREDLRKQKEKERNARLQGQKKK